MVYKKTSPNNEDVLCKFLCILDKKLRQEMLNMNAMENYLLSHSLNTLLLALIETFPIILSKKEKQVSFSLKTWHP